MPSGKLDVPGVPSCSLVPQDTIKALNNGKLVASNTGATIPGITPDNQRAYLFELVWRVIDGSLVPTKFATAVQAAGLPHHDESNGSGESFAWMLADILWASWVMLEFASEAQQPTEQPRTLLVSLVKELLIEETLLPRNVLMKVADGAMLAQAGLVVDAEVFHKKQVRLHTKLVYAQQKFNLLREDSEGYAKLLAALGAFVALQHPSDNAIAYLRMRIRCLIGLFELDPNRVLDLILDAWIAAPTDTTFASLLPEYNTEGLVHIIGLKFTHTSVPPSPALYNVAAQLVAQGHITLEGLLGHLLGEEGVVREALQQGMGALQSAVGGIGVANLTQSAEERERERQARVAAGLSDTDALPYRALYTQPLAAEHRLPLLAELIRLQAWPHVGLLWRNLQSVKTEGGGLLQPEMDEGVARALCDAALVMVGPLYEAAWPHGRWLPSAAMMGSTGAQPPMPEQLLQILQWLGPYVCLDLFLFTKLCRVLAARVPHHADDPIVEPILATSILPALALMPDNTVAVSEAWSILQHLHYTTRFRLYAGWQKVLKDDLILRASQRLAVGEAKRVLRRIHIPEDKKERREVLRPFGRRLGKVALSAPISISRLICEQARSYPNMIEPLMDAVKFFSPLAFDVLTFVLIDELASNASGKIKDDGISTADWLTNLAIFTGMLCKKYPGPMEVHAILQYVVNQLKCWQSMDLLVLERVITSMTGFTLLTDVSEVQCEALAGGQLLQQLTFNYKEAISAKAQAKGATRLMAALQQRPTKEQLAVPLLVLLAQQQTYIQLKSTQKHLKLIAEMYDKCHVALLQYLKLLAVSLTLTEYAALMPSMPSMKEEYGLDADVIMMAWRPLLRPLLTMARVTPTFAAHAGDEAVGEGGGGKEDGEDGEVEMGEGEGGEGMEVEDGEHAGQDGEREEGEADGAPSSSTPHSNGPPAGCPSWPDAASAVTALLPAHEWQAITPEFYIMFWSLTYGDIHVPHKRYEEQMRTLKDVIAEGGPDASNADAALKRLQEEYSAACEQHTIVMRRLKTLRNDWLAGVKDRGKTANAFLQHCLLPRVLCSPEDAAYCAQILYLMHDAEFLGLHSIACYDKILKDVVHMIYCLTDSEASNFGLFLAEVLRLMEGWRSDKAQYDAAAASKKGFLVSMVDPGAKQSTFEQFRKINYKWQNRALKIFVGCLKSGEYVQIRNALIVLNKVQKVYPTLQTVVEPLHAAVSEVVNDTRQDLKLMAQSYSIYLKQQQNMPGRFVPLEQYGGRPDGHKGRPSSAAANLPNPPVGDDAERSSKRQKGGSGAPVESATPDGRESKAEVASARVGPHSGGDNGEGRHITSGGRREERSGNDDKTNKEDRQQESKAGGHGEGSRRDSGKRTRDGEKKPGKSSKEREKNAERERNTDEKKDSHRRKEERREGEGGDAAHEDGGEKGGRRSRRGAAKEEGGGDDSLDKKRRRKR